MTRTCPDCGGPTSRGWTGRADAYVCCPCATARALRDWQPPAAPAQKTETSEPPPEKKP